MRGAAPRGAVPTHSFPPGDGVVERVCAPRQTVVFVCKGSRTLRVVSLFVSCCFELSQARRIILGLQEAFTKRYIVERTDKTGS